MIRSDTVGKDATTENSLFLLLTILITKEICQAHSLSVNVTHDIIRFRHTHSFLDGQNKII